MSLAEPRAAPARRYPLVAGERATDFSRIIAGEAVLLVCEVRPHVWRVRRLDRVTDTESGPVALEDVAAGFLQAGGNFD